MAAQTPETWWIVREGTLGQIVSSFDPGQITDLSVQYHVVQDAKKPNSSALGPYPTRSAAQAAADAQNAGQSGLAPAAAAAAKAAVSSASPIGGLFQGAIWLRVAEVAIGVILIGIGLNAMLKGKPLAIVTSAAGKAGKAAMLA